ncbi:MAG: 1-(5-phosphoribosyl)-5-[(5-phosphoribosylamino)methylideneamino]imidazole-4-carboxamide isomerase [Planctomycetota bacterium]|nr:MAG: 1-(5-phosphoribosyl)-5-[(5-phosphoribosylamino)methylideneamino]imidazole-4-carboxamide isomerase [Planctomycetota bacterium]
MQIWPAIDLLGGQCVRLQQGDYARETVYAADPVSVARQFAAEGARHLHLVDLDGARSGRPQNVDVVRAIVEAVDIQCELGGGVRDEATIADLLEVGLSRLVLGTAALKRPDWFRQMCRQFPGRLALGVDARGGLAATDGWLETSGVPAIDLVQQFAGEPVAAIIYTDIAADGMLQGPNVAAMRQMQSATGFDVIASGGVTTADDVAELARAGLSGAIVGRALYEGTITLAEALRAAGAAVRLSP